jgi:DNA-binding CsgD family transcriptional regulator
MTRACRRIVGDVRRAQSERGIAELRRLSTAGMSLDEFRAASLRRLRAFVTVDAAFYATVDHATMLMTSAISEEPLAGAAAQFLDNEYGVDDVNKFTAVADSAGRIGSLDQATNGDRSASPRYRDLMAPMGLGDEVRLALFSRGRCWGVMCVHREHCARGFDDTELAFLAAAAPVLGEGLRRAVAIGYDVASKHIAGGPGVLILGPDLSVVSRNQQAERWLAVVDDRDWPASAHLPVVVLGAAASTRVGDVPFSDRRCLVRRTDGAWMAVHASPLEGTGGQVVVVLDMPEPDEITSLAMSFQGLTPAQTRVAVLVLRGRSTQQIVNELGISAHTVQEHLRGVFDKFGVGSRRELVAALAGH